MEQISCTYCNSEFSIEREHVVPAAYLGYRNFRHSSQWIVDGCADCNRLAGEYLCFSIPEKAGYLAGRYKSYFKKILKIPHWDEEEIEELNYELQGKIRESQYAKIIIQRRIQYLEAVSTYPKDFKRPKWVEEAYKIHSEWIESSQAPNRP